MQSDRELKSINIQPQIEHNRTNQTGLIEPNQMQLHVRLGSIA